MIPCTDSSSDALEVASDGTSSCLHHHQVGAPFRNRSLPRPLGYRSILPCSCVKQGLLTPMVQSSMFPTVAVCGFAHMSHRTRIRIKAHLFGRRSSGGVAPSHNRTTIGSLHWILLERPPFSTLIDHWPDRQPPLHSSLLSADFKPSSRPPFAVSNPLWPFGSQFPGCSPGQDSNPLLSCPPSNPKSSSLPLRHPDATAYDRVKLRVYSKLHFYIANLLSLAFH